MYEFARGPLVWIAFILFFGGCIYRIVSIALLAKKDKVVYPYLDLKHGARSIAQWLTPYGTVNMRRRPVFYFLSGLFHFCLLVAPLFLTAHVVLFREAWGFGWWTLPEWLANAMTIVVVVIGVIFALRRVLDPTVRFVTSFGDYVILAIVLAPFVTGLLAYYQVFDYKTVVILHIWTGALWLVAIPFSRLAHMFFFPLARAYMGSEFGFRGAKDW
jgi:nitrate reductase gamma subunit